MSENKKSFRRTYTLVILLIMLVALLALKFFHWKNSTDLPQEYQNNLNLNEYLQQHMPLLQNPFAGSDKINLGETELVAYEAGFSARDGELVRVLVSKPQGAGPFPVMIIVHGVMADDLTTNQTAKVLADPLSKKLGIITVTVDWRESKFGQGDLTDVVSTVDWVKKLQEAKDQPVLLFGEDHGAYLSLLALKDVSVDGLISAYGYLDLFNLYDTWKNSAEESRREQADRLATRSGCAEEIDIASCLQSLSLNSLLDVKIPLLILHSQYDNYVPLAQAELLNSLTAPDLTTFTIFTEVNNDSSQKIGHNFLQNTQAVGYEQGITAVVDWTNDLLNQLKSPENSAVYVPIINSTDLVNP
ncbi:MAG: hypothetical protein A2233_05105 [Candidatus Kerfeldbacteria bacterium RIFOXYA2_FULL_38_24]|uniref:Uncharacterized protein n=1 Tax=Candidatus Kerfeldbacteria bacterium RIFOXYB2_FULL_38_14 TaxID=1798547 RepID=A0A1G2BGQ0_9BACT|nr:MAG: hypothetical protein A2233_05105 [Candidatus Kerfeldbacteria bacterium RIFOXYA2_FULL_38_24]OGY88393.1 MAG: hypothetical protein A2319_05145 [Candidatus Kerfeldbacteria bacterium RIFOXYB2_FULL_38_14]OGY89086.1 MAG: hypothetical protein A2458_00755 [Candidatus Kerfeldbacteria bacterium RIFOXYC2_FULL_38_9]